MVTTEQLRQISIFSRLEPDSLVQLQPHGALKQYLQGEIVLHEGDRLPAKLFAVVSGTIQVKKTAATGKETILRMLPPGEIFAAPSLFGDGFSPATVVAQEDCQILTVERSALLGIIGQNPEVALQIVAVLTERLQHLHDTVHGLISERAIVRLAKYIQAAVVKEGVETTENGLCLRSRLPYYHIARSIGITYEECVRLFKQIQSIVSYHRGGKILLLDRDKLDAIASGELTLPNS
jgi:CRP/FNR family transcriptional regulator, cyclic AMP receptor protein